MSYDYHGLRNECVVVMLTSPYHLEFMNLVCPIFSMKYKATEGLGNVEEEPKLNIIYKMASSHDFEKNISL